MRTLTQRELNRAVLARQHLLERARPPVPRVLERIGGLQAQYAPAMYVGLWSRVDGFKRGELTELLERRAVVQGTLLRSTIHLVSAEDYWPWALAVREARRQWYLRVTRTPVDEIEVAAGRLRAAMADGPIRQTEIDRLVGRRLRNAVGMWLDLVRVPPSGTWERRRADLYELAERWLGPPAVTADEGLELLVRRYLSGFGPAHRADIANWAGLPVAAVAPVLERLELRRHRTEDGAELVDLPDAPLLDADMSVPVCFLPTWDATLLAHARRTQILPEAHRAKVFNTKNPHSVCTFLVDGAVAGAWRYDGGRIRLEEFDRLPKSTRRSLAEQAERLAEFHAADA